MSRNTDLRPLPGSVLDQRECRKTVVVRVVEKLDKLVIHTQTIYDRKALAKQAYYKTHPDEMPKDHKGTVTRAKMLCVNGPYAGQHWLPQEVESEGYEQYNRSYGRGPVRAGEAPKTVLVQFR